MEYGAYLAVLDDGVNENLRLKEVEKELASVTEELKQLKNRSEKAYFIKRFILKHKIKKLQAEEDRLYSEKVRIENNIMTIDELKGLFEE